MKRPVTDQELLELVKDRLASAVGPAPEPKKKRRKTARKLPVSLTDEEVLKILIAARKRCIRDWLIILITYRHGLRASETLNIRRRDVAHGRLQVQRGKGSAHTDQPLMSHENPLFDEMGAIEQWLADMTERGKKGTANPGGRRSRDRRRQSTQNVTFRQDDEERLFPITRQHFFRVFRRYCREVGIDDRKASPHKLKHTIAKTLIRDGAPPNEVKKWLGWKSLTTADHYTEADDDEVAQTIDHLIRAKTAFRRAYQEILFK